MQLPQLFLDKMKDLLREQYAAFVASYEEEKARGLRVNPLKAPVRDFLRIAPFELTEVPWVSEGFYYGKEDRPGKHPYHEAGLIYIQEPSAMAVGALVDPRPGETVLDLCAAPGGKTTHLAGRMNGEGLLVANEPHPARAKILSQNVERLGVRNAVVTNEMPDKLAARFPAFFDRILVDAPCSGEGMFRKDPDACAEWSPEHVTMCADRQLDILESAAKMLKPGGRLVYSTCTFSPEENEGTISRFAERHPEFAIEDAQAYEGFDRGRADWTADAAPGIGETLRLWPHRIRGEGHYAAVLRKADGEELPVRRKHAKGFNDLKALKDYFSFADEALTVTPAGEFTLFGDQLYLLPSGMLSLDQLKVVRPGWHLGTLKKNRFEPSHALALSLKGDEVRNRLSLPAESPQMLAYLKGEALEAEGPKGWRLVEVDGYSIGWGKVADGTLKNHFPKGLRWTGR
ncbi:RsmF rRNA methyltransferase first C-terminal domain-containing protein [Cohnella hongkongensis]|uniref:RsmF rRNA methyltransferase first C-terminal domain-containing protein n=1 Tax=Cohnella hongkongensis TaxID=178337 RepID=A0ABV9FCD8_9BACL